MSDDPVQGAAPGDGRTPDPASAPVAMLLAGLGRLARSALDGALARDGLSLRHIGAIGHLAARPGLSLTELARRADVSAPSMLATVRRLEEAGLVHRVTPPGRGRTARLEATDAGRSALAAARRHAAALDDRLLAGLGQDDRSTLTALLLRAAANARDEMRP
ncbi:MarR family winged helix-turn-helix transcriptional regulator [Streptacidiphilus sp. ASG 303]|uniref:MarR family winged helix-turn-helix transcriptional regulator n=1 Tax=Streptacidiphilus sp. ASG 303 TaxID=2896847 RepID=UPI001E32E343|nr:MarR family winged helix-turn-helix transcriptional regulator [Streptacidiphilus sp. ASG 303]MCD0483532.1 MarR family winged helix-turn-helix transcriptional regulator [Streptacidiphilus sp. ASG 303]